MTTRNLKLILLAGLATAVICGAALSWSGSGSADSTDEFVLSFNASSATVLSCCYEGWAGMVFTVGANPLKVTELGRWMIEGNRNTHVIKIVGADSKTEVAGTSVTLSLAGRVPGRFHYAALPEPVTLRPNATYYLVSSEKAIDNQQDYFYAHDAAVATAGVAFVRRPIHWAENAWKESQSDGTAYGPLSFKYVRDSDH